MDLKFVVALRGCTRVKVVLKQIFGSKRNEASVQLRVFVLRMLGFMYTILLLAVAYPRILFNVGGSTNSVKDRGKRTGMWGW